MRPRSNPFERFGEQLAADLPPLLDGDLEDYHAYAFATVRMVGAAFELASSHVEWLLGQEAEAAMAAMREIVDGCKVLGFKLARRRAFEHAPIIAALGFSWERAMGVLEEVIG